MTLFASRKMNGLTCNIANLSNYIQFLHNVPKKNSEGFFINQNTRPIFFIQLRIILAFAMSVISTEWSKILILVDLFVCLTCMAQRVALHYKQTTRSKE